MSVAVDLVAGMEKTAIAAKYEINRSTIYDWMKLTEFQEIISKLSDELYERMRWKLLSLSPKALDRLETAMDSKNYLASVNAAKAVLDRAGFATELITKLQLEQPETQPEKLTSDDISRRIAELKAKRAV
jgi:hypothetical protein